MSNEATFEDAETMIEGIGSRPAVPAPAIPHEILFDTTPRDPAGIRPVAEDLEYLFEHSQELMCVASTDGFFLKVNPAFEKTLGWTMAQLRSRPFIDFVHPLDRDQTVAAMEVLARGKPVGQFDNRYLCADGSYKTLSWNAYPRGDGTLSAIARDVTSYHRRLSDEVDIGDTIQHNLKTYFSSKGSGFGDPTDAAEKGVKWIKWGVAFIVFVFGAGVAYSQWIADNATKTDLQDHVQQDLIPVKEDVSSVKVSVEALVAAESGRAKSEEKRAAREAEQARVDKKMHLLDAHRAEYQEAMSEYTASKAAGKRATRPRKTPEHLALEGELGIPSRN